MNGVVARQFPCLVTLRTGDGAIPNAGTACGAGLNKDGVAIGADFGPSGEFEIAPRAREDKTESAIRTDFGLVVDGRPAAGAHELPTFRTYPVSVIHRSVAGRAAVQLRYVRWKVKLNVERAFLGLPVVVFPTF